MSRIEVSKIIEWDMGHRIPAHDSLCRFPHGHRYRLEVSVTGKICQISGDSSEGMVVDFGHLKSVMKTEVHDLLDHQFVYSEQDRVVGDWAEKNFSNGSIAVSFIPTAENLVAWCYELLRPKLDEVGVEIVRLRLYETPNSWADFVVDPVGRALD